MTPKRIAFLRDIVAERAATHGKGWTGPHGESLLQSADAIRELCAHLDTLTAERNTLLDRVDRLTAALAREQGERREEVDTLTAELNEARRDAAYWTTIRDYVVRVDAVARPGGRMGDDDIASVVMQVLRRRAADHARLSSQIAMIHDRAEPAEDLGLGDFLVQIQTLTAERDAYKEAAEAVLLGKRPEVPRAD